MDALIVWKKHIDIACPEHSSFVFCTRSGNMRTYSGLRSSYRRFLKRHDLPEEGMNLHCYRHTFATMLLENGVNPRVVQRLMGHSEIGTTLGTYSHVVQEVYSEVAEVLGDVYRNTLNGTYFPRLMGNEIAVTAREISSEPEITIS